MMNKGPGAPKVFFGPQARDFLPPKKVTAEDLARGAAPPPGANVEAGNVDGRVRAEVTDSQNNTARLIEDLRADGRSRRPEPRLPGKHALNPPIVTIFGAGVAGLTAAHELVDRGFLVQVVEDREDPYCPGRPLVGGMAANQPARVRANIEDIHRDLMVLALTPRVASEKKKYESERKVAAWLLRIFAFNRSRWIQTETPYRMNGCIFPSDDGPGAAAFRKNLLQNLKGARQQYKERWIWDLIMRGVLLGAIKPDDSLVDAIAEAQAACQALAGAEQGDGPVTHLPLAQVLLGFLSNPNLPDEPSADDIDACEETVTRAFEREFLCFRLVPHARRGLQGAAADARKLYSEWVGRFGSDGEFGTFQHSLISGGAGGAKPILASGDATSTVEVLSGDAEPDFPYRAWLQLDVIEQRLPGEHGYRFFPSFYRHLEDTMGRIPLHSVGIRTGQSVLDNLKPTLFQGIGLSKEDRAQIVKQRDNKRRENLEKDGRVQPDERYPDFDDPALEACAPPANGTVVELHRERPQSMEAFRDCTDRFVRRLGGTRTDAVLLLAKLVRFMTSSPERRKKEYEDKTWAEFVKVEKFSQPMRFQIESAAQALLAFSATEADARTYGNVAVQMLLDELRDGTRVDRTLNGPTSDAWLEPWREHLERQGVRFFCRTLEALEIRNGELIPRLDDREKNSVSQDAHDLLTADMPHEGLKPDFYILALNFEQTRRLIEKREVCADPKSLALDDALSQHFAEMAPDFAKLVPFASRVDHTHAMKTMTGMQYFFDAKTDVGRGHLYFPFSEWGLSSISQSEFWSERGGFSDGYFGLLSMDVCTTDTPAGARSFLGSLKPEVQDGGLLTGQRAFRTASTALDQVRKRIGGTDLLGDPRCFHIDRNLFRTGDQKTQFLASVVGLDKSRPGRNATCVGPKEIEYHINCKRWVLCGTFMATHTRMTTMEAANESARHAVAAILKQLSVDDASGLVTGMFGGRGYQIENLANENYNWASQFRTYEPPSTWNPEDRELDDLDFFRRVDRRLVKLDLPHFMDIMNFDRKLENALEAMDIYGEEKPLSELFGASFASLDSLLVRELGRGYASLEESRWREAKGLKSADPPFSDMNQLGERFKQFLALFTGLSGSP